MILTAAQNFLTTIWPLVEILRSLVVYVNHHNKDYLAIGFATTMRLLSNYFDLLFVDHQVISVGKYAAHFMPAD